MPTTDFPSPSAWLRYRYTALAFFAGLYDVALDSLESFTLPSSHPLNASRLPVSRTDVGGIIDQRVLVTGAASGLGREVVLTAVEAAVASVAGPIGGTDERKRTLTIVALDVAKPEHFLNLVTDVAAICRADSDPPRPALFDHVFTTRFTTPRLTITLHLARVDLLSVSSLTNFLHNDLPRLIPSSTPFTTLFLNAGAVTLSFHKTSAGLDRLFHLHVLANHQLVRSLISQNLVCPNTTRILLTASDAHRGDPPPPDFFASPKSYSLMVPREYGWDGGQLAYARSKFLALAWLAELFRRHHPTPNIPTPRFAAFCPGAMRTNIAASAAGEWALARFAAEYVVGPCLPSPKGAAATVFYLMTADERKWEEARKSLQGSGDVPVYVHLGKVEDPHPDAWNGTVGKKLWEELEEILRKEGGAEGPKL
ncbi:hypothetical protein M427DRAFT_56466 [Gonapodya prolifera JEL478]|uniref:NAD(P)-binding protein n=1 Tax=Gonapodya prolifera (strain JEL478) TaxID=1344416 RepID=A0A139AGM3_GONPJ|nr:hypothetical protein M427DRAFT_56466 [Gonapodya prolifera JEL478]|eukprot:KXS15900.1 hypothetical protein M427DRAFT_56466 [Gonapodya prolifera JEL478]